MLQKLLAHLQRKVKDYKLRSEFKKYCALDRSTVVVFPAKAEGLNKIHHDSFFHGSLGFGTYIGPRSRVSADVGRYTSIAEEVQTISGTHPYRSPYVTTSPCLVVTNPLKIQNGGSLVKKDCFNQFRYFDETRKIDVKIGSDCWIGTRALLIGGINIGDGAVVLANAVVTKDVPPYAIVGGVPAKVIKYRYDAETIDFLLKDQWWNTPVEVLKENIALFCNIDEYKRHPFKKV